MDSDSEITDKVNLLYREILEREADSDGLNNCINGIKNNTLTFEGIKSHLLNSEEFKQLQVKKQSLEHLKSLVVKPIFIIGVPRTGTTLLYRIMCQHPDLAWFSHLDLKFFFPPEEQEKLKKHYTELKEKGEPVPRNEESLFVFGTNQGKALEGTNKVPTEGGTFWAKFLGNKPGNVPEAKKNKILEVLSNVLSSQGKTRFLNKSPQNSVRLFELKQIFPDAKFINCTRDPRAVVSSMIVRYEKEGEFDPGIPIDDRSELDKLDFVQKWAWYYRVMTDAIHDFSVLQDESNFMTLTYEEFLAHPYENLKNIFRFCELKQLPDLKKIVPPLFKKTNEQWKERFTDEDQKKIFDMVTDSIKKMNYPYSL